MSNSNGPLDGLRVIDCSGMISGGFATMQLADFGADVVMVEHPEYRDPIRDFAPEDDGDSLWWKSLGRNKRCVTLDLKSEEGAALLLDLVSDADLFFENFRPGTLERWGLGPEKLREENNGLIVVRISGYGQTGPHSQKPGFGTVAEGISGWAHANGFADREPLLPPISLADLTAAHFAIEASMFALFEREIGHGGSGEGQVIDVSLYEPLFRQFIPDVEAYDRLQTVRERTGNRHSSAAPRNIYETEDGYLTLSASSQSIFERVMAAIDREELIDDPRFENNERRVENAAELDSYIESWTRERTTDEAIERMEACDAIVGPVYTIEDIFESEQFAARDNIVQVADSDVGEMQTFGVVPKFSRTPGDVSYMGPQHGEHNEQIFLEELDLDPERYQQLRADGVI